MNPNQGEVEVIQSLLNTLLHPCRCENKLGLRSRIFATSPRNREGGVLQSGLSRCHYMGGQVFRPVVDNIGKTTITINLALKMGGRGGEC